MNHEKFEKYVDAAIAGSTELARETAQQIVSWELWCHWSWFVVCLSVMGAFIWLSFALDAEAKKEISEKEKKSAAEASLVTLCISVVFGVASLANVHFAVKAHVAPNVVVAEYVKGMVSK